MPIAPAVIHPAQIGWTQARSIWNFRRTMVLEHDAVLMTIQRRHGCAGMAGTRISIHTIGVRFCNGSGRKCWCLIKVKTIMTFPRILMVTMRQRLP